MAWILNYPELVCTFAGWFVASVLKIPVYYFLDHKVDLKLAFGAGGMPSSHSGLIVSTALGIGLFSGFNSPVFALAVAVSMIVLYDAAGVRRQAGIHAERINMIFEELWKGNPINETELKEMLGHTPLEVLGGILTGILSALFVWLVWPK